MLYAMCYCIDEDGKRSANHCRDYQQPTIAELRCFSATKLNVFLMVAARRGDWCRYNALRAEWRRRFPMP